MLVLVKTVQPAQDYRTASSRFSLPIQHKSNQMSSNSEPCFYDSIQMVDNEVRQHFQQEKPRKPKLKLNPKQRMQMNGCVTSPIGYDVFLSCSSGSELDWITKQAVPQLQ